MCDFNATWGFSKRTLKRRNKKLSSNYGLENNTQAEHENLCNQTSSSSLNETSQINEISDSTSSSSGTEENISIDLAKWATENRITATAMNKLLKILKPTFPYLPKDSRTLLHTPQKNDIISLSGGSYVHLGVLNSLRHQLSNIDFFSPEISIDVCIDGLPISKSSNVGFWPILGLIRNFEFQMPPFVIGIFYGTSKPDSNNEFLSNFVADIQSVTNSAQSINGKEIFISIRSF